MKLHPNLFCFILVLGTLVGSASATILTANQVVLRDCAGELLAQQELEIGESADIQFTLPLADNVTQYTLISSLGETLSAVSKNSMLKFTDVSHGDWRMCQQSGEKIEFVNLDISSHSSATEVSGLASVAMAGALAVPIGIVGGGAFDNGSSNSGRGLIGAGSGSQQEQEKPIVSSAALQDEPEFLDEDYDFGAPAAPLSPSS